MKSKEPRLREMVAKNWSQWRMAKELGLNASTVSLYLTRLDIPHAKRVCDIDRRVLPIVLELRAARMARGLTLKDLSIRSGWCISVIGEWERGARRIHGPGLVDYANSLDFDVALVKRVA